MPDRDDNAREVWLLMSDLVLDNHRRRAVSDALGMSFGRSRALRRLARRPMSMRELADALGSTRRTRRCSSTTSRPRASSAARPHPTDRRAKLVEATRKGKELARRADEILATPPPELSALGADDLEALRRLLARARYRE